MEKPRVAWARATYGSRLRILRWHADVVSSSSFRVSLRIFEQKRDCSQSMPECDTRNMIATQKYNNFMHCALSERITKLLVICMIE